MTINRLLSGAAGLAALFFATHAGADVSKDIRDWSVSCSGGLTCTMNFTNATWDEKGINVLAFLRTDDPNADVELQVSTPAGFDEKGDVKGIYSFVIDGKAVLTLPVSKLKHEGSNLSYEDDAAVRALLAEMKAGTSMQLNYAGSLGTFTLAVKLTGVAGSMLYMDDMQGRLKRTDALEDKGNLAPPKTAQAEDITNIGDLPAAIRKDFAGDGECSGLDDDISSFPAFRMALADIDLYVVPCGQDGAYNQPYAAYFEKDGHFHSIAFPGTMDDGSFDNDSTPYNVDFDPKTREFTSFFKGRGQGDCGLWSKWKLVGGKKPVAKLVEERRKDDCNGTGEGPDKFPLTWSATKK